MSAHYVYQQGGKPPQRVKKEYCRWYPKGSSPFADKSAHWEVSYIGTAAVRTIPPEEETRLAELDAQLVALHKEKMAVIKRAFIRGEHPEKE